MRSFTFAAQIVEVEVPAGVRLHLLEPVARHGHARGVRPVRGVRDDDRVALLAPVGEVRAHEHEPRELSLRAGRRLQRDRGKPGDLREHRLQAPHELERTLRSLVLLGGMEIAESGESSEPLVEARVVLHRAGAERVEARVHAERTVGERGEVADELGLGDLGETRRPRSAKRGGELDLGEIGPRRPTCSPSGTRALEDEWRVRPSAAGLVAHEQTSPRTSASRSTSSTVFLSVTATRRTSSIPS